MRQTPRFRILSYNIKMLPSLGLPFLGRGERDRRRAERIARVLAGTEPPYDVLCLQEVFDRGATNSLSGQLRAEFPYQRIRYPYDNLLFPSGLFMASRHPIEASHFQGFVRAQWPTADWFAHKGVLGIRVDLSARLPDHSLWLFNTHLQSGHYRFVRQGQMRQLVEFMRHRLMKTPAEVLSRTGVMLMGDFNVVAEYYEDGRIQPTGEFTRMLEVLGRPRDLYRQAHPDGPGFTWMPEDNDQIPSSNDPGNKRLDYVFAYDRVPTLGESDSPRLARLDCLQIEVEPFPHIGPRGRLSDHYGLSVTLSITESRSD
jgi:endonuclease/exonuclease/phosphatase family metal-dependent hydrolase